MALMEKPTARERLADAAFALFSVA